LPMKTMKKPAAAKGTASKKAAKSMKSMKAKKVSVIAKGKRARSAVFAGSKEKTQSGLQKKDLMKNSSGKIVTKKAHASAKKNYVGSKLEQWAKACKQARKELQITGFVPIGGASPAGKALYAKVKSILAAYS